MKIVRFVTTFQCSMIALALMSGVPSLAFAQDGHAHAQEQSEVSSAQASALIQTVRQATERFKDVHTAEAEGYQLQFGCVSGGDFGAMGLHYVNGALVNSGVVDPAHPQIVIYEPTADGKLRLIGADFLVMAARWNAHHKGQPPQLMGQLFHLFDAPNRFGLPAFYTLHVWAWKPNPNGAFVNWHPNVNCQNFNPVN